MAPPGLHLGSPKKLPCRPGACFSKFFLISAFLSNSEAPRRYGQICLPRGRELAVPKNVPAALDLVFQSFSKHLCFCQKLKLLEGTDRFGSPGAASWQPWQKVVDAGGSSEDVLGCSGDTLGFSGDAVVTLWALWGRSCMVWGCSGDTLGRSGDALGTFWIALGTLWRRAWDALGVYANGW